MWWWYKMIEVRYVTENDKSFWDTLDRNFDEREFALKIRDKRGYVITADCIPIGIMRYNLIWDNTPFLTLIYIQKANQGKGFGKQAMMRWENEMRNLGYKMVMTSTQVDEQAQHFYRKIGYIDRGGIFLDNTPLKQPQEMFMIKAINQES
jgi:GNAT superfamily N-acetyltransferase